MNQDITKLLKININFKDFIIGLLLGLCVMLVVAAGSNNNSSVIYQCCPAGDDNSAVFIINSQTGQTWRFSRNDHYDYGTPQQRKSLRKTVMPYVE